jgi:hypothetical protein
VSGWRGAWAAAQITGVLFSTLVWIVVWGLSLPAFAGALVVGAIAVAGRNTRPMLCWRFGARSANDLEREAMLTAVVPIASMRGRRQPSIWIGRRLDGCHVVMPTHSALVVSPELLRRVVTGQLTDRQTSAIVSEALGLCWVLDSTMVNAVEAYCLPWRFVQFFTGALAQRATRHSILGFSWKIRWIVFGLAIVDAYRSARWAALIGVVLIAVLSWSTGHLETRWALKLQCLADHRDPRRPRISPTSSGAPTSSLAAS